MISRAVTARSTDWTPPTSRATVASLLMTQR
jgi:hypothetical protein